MILTPSRGYPEITRTYGGSGTYLCPEDPYQYQRGEAGFYHDTHLGQTVPTDAELSKTYGYTPYNYGWVNGRMADGRPAYYPGAWVPPNGWTPGPRAPMAFGDAAQEVAVELNMHNRRMFQLQMIATIAVAASALLAIFRTGGLIREDAQRRAG